MLCDNYYLPRRVYALVDGQVQLSRIAVIVMFVLRRLVYAIHALMESLTMLYRSTILTPVQSMMQ